MILITPKEEDLGKRLDFFATEILGVSRAFTHKLIEKGKVKVNLEAEKPSYHVRAGDKISIDFDPKKIKIPSIKMPIIYEDDDCVVISKPAGVLSHNKGEYNPEATVATWLHQKLEARGQSLENVFPNSKLQTSNSRQGIVHRLDRGTSGVMIAAKNEQALKWLQKQFSQRKVKKSYVALVQGVPEPSEAVIDMPIERHPRTPKIFRVGTGGKPAITVYKTLKSNSKYSFLELSPHTGRTHQLRVHMKQLGHAIVGDELYGGESADRLYLHAKTLEITLPNKERKVFESPVPALFNNKMKV